MDTKKIIDQRERKKPVLPPPGSKEGGLWLGQAEIDRRYQKFISKGIMFPSLVARDPEPEWLYLTAEASDGNGVRGLFMGDHAIWWPADAGTHGDARRWLNIKTDCTLSCRFNDIEFHLLYSNVRRPGHAFGGYFVANNQGVLDQLLKLPSIFPYLDEKREGLRDLRSLRSRPAPTSPSS